MTNRVIIIGFNGAEGLDIFGPAEVFSTASSELGTSVYHVELACLDGGLIVLSSNLAVAARKLSSIRPQPEDTVLVVGGTDRAVDEAAAAAPLLAWLARAARSVRRIGSICDGAFILARAGILNGKRATTHWSSCSRLARNYPQIEVDRDAIFVRAEQVWTSAGVTTGIDMALAMLEQDHGSRVADSVAAQLVVYARRPGFQSQFSEVLVAQSAASDPLGPLVIWLRANLRASLDVSKLALRAGMSVRSLHRQCSQRLDTTPAKLVEKVRIEQARTLLATTSLGTKTVAARCGFGSAARMTLVFKRNLGIAPGTYRTLFSGQSMGRIAGS